MKRFKRNLPAALFITFSLLISALPLTARAKTPEARSRFATLDNLKVHYQSFGKGSDALVFIHGWTCNLNFWKANYPAFTEQTRVILIDLPGHGQSDKPQITYSMDLFARAIDAVLREAKVKRATLIGHSMGTPVIRQFYRLYPDKTRALVIVDGGLRPMGTAESMKPFLEPFRQPGYKEHAERMIEFLAKGMKSPDIVAEVKAAMSSAPQHVMVSAMEEMMNPAIWKTQDKINVPTLAVMANNPMFNAEYEKYVRDLAPGIEYQTWSDVSHFLMMDEPQKFNETVLAFLKKNKLIRQ